ncbi:hypothetical protein ASC97_16385 [Rhizobium sp. Root1203]|uniref:hypothetical protein n=1 Tax=Rhizobium sp. Root1203 TaxID=1736427 RepID=UPI00070EF25D|nr:hypothetical protein [Rhizobium sp. Root1203]KQV10881.1 hypothetical protein ASC97_16385 [Rhizobium sp. Root1203]
MTVFRKLGILLIAAGMGFVGLDAAEELAIPGVHSFVSTAEARVGRPLTPVSVAGVARRSSRRCAAGVYNC